GGFAPLGDGAGVVRPRVEIDAQARLDAQRAHDARDLDRDAYRDALRNARREVDHFPRTLAAFEVRDDDVGVRQVGADAAHLVAVRQDAETAAVLPVEQTGEDRRRIEARQAEPFDGAARRD